jgi:hypothetical protein
VKHKNIRASVAALLALVTAIALTGFARADTTVTATAGPVAVPGVPLEICVRQDDTPEPVDECVITPEAQTVALTVAAHVASPEADIVPPRITPIECPSGTEGVALRTTTGNTDTTIGGSVTVTVLVDGTVVTETIPVDDVMVGPEQTVTVFACAGAEPGVPVPGVPEVPEPEVPGAPEVPEPEVPGAPEVPEPEVPGAPEVPEPEVPGAPEVPEPEVPGAPEVPEPEVPGAPEVPEPEVPGLPALEGSAEILLRLVAGLALRL